MHRRESRNAKGAIIMKYLYAAGLLASVIFTAVITHKVDDSIYQKGIILRQKLEIEKQKKVVELQSEISKKTEGKRHDIQNRYDHLMSQYIGVRKQYTDELSNRSPAFTIPADGFRIHGEDAGFLITFAKNCSITELERNEVIEKYNSLEVE